MSQTSKTNNTTFTGTTKITSPIPGESYYDASIDELYVFDGTNWVPSSPIIPDSTKFEIFTTNDISYAKIVGRSWWGENDIEIIKWLDDNQAGYYIPEFRAISFFDHKFATLFKIRWC